VLSKGRTSGCFGLEQVSERRAALADAGDKPDARREHCVECCRVLPNHYKPGLACVGVLAQWDNEVHAEKTPRFVKYPT
jgi:hypothetical protein